jgi:multiple sugar transport system permease protein
LLNPQFGLINFGFYRVFGLTGPQWLLSDTWVIPSFVLMSLWGAGGPMVIFLAGLQGVPTELYEAAAIDGANAWHRFISVTLPMISPVILFQLITGMIGAFQFFTPAFVMTQGGPDNQSLFYVLYLYQNGLQYFRMGYANAQAWILFVVILLCTYVALRISRRYVYYQGGDR